MDTAKLKTFIDTMWDDTVIPTLVEYIRIPNKSPAYDPDWEAKGYMMQAVALFESWARERIAVIPGATFEVLREPGRTPLIFMELPGNSDDTVLLYGHIDKQPEMEGWAEGAGPWIPVLKDDRLYGRGGGDDGYAMFAALSALLALHEQNVPRARAVVLIEACEESGSYDLPFYIDALAPRIGEPSLVICLDSGCGDYDRLWLTASLRGNIAGTLSVRVLDEGVHSGAASGVVPSSFRILRQLLGRLEDEKTGQIIPRSFYSAVPPQRVEQIKRVAQILGSRVYDQFPFSSGVQPVTHDLSELILNRTWRPQLAVTGIEGLPAPQNAGNVQLPIITAKLSIRLPPNLAAQKVHDTLKELLESHPPYGAQVHYKGEPAMGGWDAPALAPWLETVVDNASNATFGQPAAYTGEGGSIPFMAMLGEKFPRTQFVVTGVLGPHSNAHGPNEFLHIPTARRVSTAVAIILAAHYRQSRS